MVTKFGSMHGFLIVNSKDLLSEVGETLPAVPVTSIVYVLLVEPEKSRFVSLSIVNTLVMSSNDRGLKVPIITLFPLESVIV